VNGCSALVEQQHRSVTCPRCGGNPRTRAATMPLARTRARWRG